MPKNKKNSPPVARRTALVLPPVRKLVANNDPVFVHAIVAWDHGNAEDDNAVVEAEDDDPVLVQGRFGTGLGLLVRGIADYDPCEAEGRSEHHDRRECECCKCLFHFLLQNGQFL